MRFLKNFILFLESLSFIDRINDWKIEYNHSKGHDLNDRIKRTDLSDKDFDLFLNKIIDNCEKEKIDGNAVFTSFDYRCKIVSNVNMSDKEILIVTFLGANEKLNINDKCIMI